MRIGEFKNFLKGGKKMRILKRVLYFLLMILLVSGCAKTGEKKETEKVRQKGMVEEKKKEAEEVFLVFKEVSLAMVSGEAEKVLSLTTKKFQNNLLSDNRMALARAKDNKEMQKIIEQQFGKKYEELIAMSDKELLTLIIEKIKLPPEELEKIKEKVEKTEVLDKKIEGDTCTLKTKDAEGRVDIAILKLKEGSWLLDEIKQ